MGRNAGSTLIVALLSLPRPLEPIGISSTNFRLRRHFRRAGTSESSCPESSLYRPYLSLSALAEVPSSHRRITIGNARDLNLLTRTIVRTWVSLCTCDWFI